MTILLWIMAVLALLIFLILLLRVGVRLTIQKELLLVEAAVGPFRLQLSPRKEKKEPAPTEQTVPQDAAPKKQKKKGPRPTFTEIRELLRTLWPPLKRALGRTRRSIRVSPLQLSLTVGGEEDPASAAQLYGELHGAVWTVMPALEQLVRIKDPYVHIGIDFDAGKTLAEGTVGIAARLGTLLRAALSVAIPGARWFLAFRKRHQPTQAAQPAPAAEPLN